MSRLFTVTLLIYNLYVDYIMWNAGLEKVQVEIKIAGRNINNLRYADDTTLMTESEQELKSLLMKVKEEEWKSWLKTQHSKNSIMASSPITSWQIDGERMETVTYLSWAPKNWCYWTVVLEKTLESPLNCKEIQPVSLTPLSNWPDWLTDWLV